MNADDRLARVRLTQFSHGGGCGCKIASRNWAGYGSDVALPDADSDAVRALLTDPQTSGGLLVACAPETVDTVLGVFRDEGFARAAAIGEITAGPAVVRVR